MKQDKCNNLISNTDIKLMIRDSHICMDNERFEIFHSGLQEKANNIKELYLLFEENINEQSKEYGNLENLVQTALTFHNLEKIYLATLPSELLLHITDNLDKFKQLKDFTITALTNPEVSLKDELLNKLSTKLLKSGSIESINLLQKLDNSFEFTKPSTISFCESLAEMGSLKKLSLFNVMNSQTDWDESDKSIKNNFELIKNIIKNNKQLSYLDIAYTPFISPTQNAIDLLNVAKESPYLQKLYLFIYNAESDDSPDSLNLLFKENSNYIEDCEEFISALEKTNIDSLYYIYYQAEGETDFKEDSDVLAFDEEDVDELGYSEDYKEYMRAAAERTNNILVQNKIKNEEASRITEKIESAISKEEIIDKDEIIKLPRGIFSEKIKNNKEEANLVSDYDNEISKLDDENCQHLRIEKLLIAKRNATLDENFKTECLDLVKKRLDIKYPEKNIYDNVMSIIDRSWMRRLAISRLSNFPIQASSLLSTENLYIDRLPETVLENIGKHLDEDVDLSLPTDSITIDSHISRIEEERSNKRSRSEYEFNFDSENDNEKINEPESKRRR